MPRNDQAPEIPPPLELECLKALWRLGDGSVKDVRGILTERRNLAYTTVMTVLDRLVKRGSVKRQKHGRSFIYTPLVGQDLLRHLAVQDLVETFFEGSEQELLAFMNGETVSESTPEQSAEGEVSEPLDTELL